MRTMHGALEWGGGPALEYVTEAASITKTPKVLVKSLTRVTEIRAAGSI